VHVRAHPRLTGRPVRDEHPEFAVTPFLVTLFTTGFGYLLGLGNYGVAEKDFGWAHRHVTRHCMDCRV
jgi:hypothetical protein